jgi:hypothetical protein
MPISNEKLININESTASIHGADDKVFLLLQTALGYIVDDKLREDFFHEAVSKGLLTGNGTVLKARIGAQGSLLAYSQQGYRALDVVEGSEAEMLASTTDDVVFVPSTEYALSDTRVSFMKMVRP